MPILLHKVSASSIECVVIITLLFFPNFEVLCIIDHINLLASGSIPVDGSSNKTICGLHKREIATDNLRLFPPDNLPATFLVYSSKAISIIIVFTTFSKYIFLTPFILA